MTLIGMFQSISKPEAWVEGAICPQIGDGDLWFPEKGTSARAARGICLSCPVRSDCLDYAFRHHIREGIYGGFSGKDRERLNHGGNPLRGRVPLNANGHGYNCHCYACKAAA